jgi:molybdenum cofactor cytidylyltransferase
MKISAIILAAGNSSRLGHPKQLVGYQGKTLIERIIETALSATDEVIVVLGANSEKITSVLTPLVVNNEKRVKIVENIYWQEGMASSIKTGMQVIRNEVKGVLLLLSDQPFVDSELLQTMVQNFAKNDQKIIACRYREQLGVPILYPNLFFSQLNQLTGVGGAKSILSDNLGSIITVDFPAGIFDIDTPQDLEMLK